MSAPAVEPPGVPRHELVRAAAEARSLRQVARRLGLTPNGRGYALITDALRRYGIEAAHLDTRKRFGTSIDPAALRNAVSGAHSLAAVLRALGIPENGTTRRHLKQAIDQHGLSTGHFTGQGHRAGLRSPHRRPASDILRRLAPGAPRTRRILLHRALQEVGEPYVCRRCGLGALWRGKRLVLEIDHVNGDRLDNRRDNLRYLCPSCHSQTDTFAGAGRRAR